MYQNIVVFCFSTTGSKLSDSFKQNNGNVQPKRTNEELQNNNYRYLTILTERPSYFQLYFKKTEADILSRTENTRREFVKGIDNFECDEFDILSFGTFTP